MRHPVLPIDAVALCGRQAPWIVDIGCGQGAFVAAMAQAQPQHNVLGLEIRPHLVNEANAHLAALGLHHAHVVYANANAHLDTLVADGQIEVCTINFPDPWFKLRHRKRRVLDAALVAVLQKKLSAKGRVFAMTDVRSLAEAMRHTLVQAGFVDLHSVSPWPTASDTGIASERELWHQRQNDPIWRLAFAPPPLGNGVAHRKNPC